MDNRLRVYKLFNICTAFVDVFILYSGVLLALRIKFFSSATALSEQNLTDIDTMLPLICVVGLILLYVNGLYTKPERTIFDVLYVVIVSVLFLTVITMALSFFVRSFAFPRTVIMGSALLQLVLLSVWRVVALQIGRLLHGRQTVLVVGHRDEMQRMVEKILFSSGRLYTIKYLFDLDKDYKELRKLIPQVDHVFVCPHISRDERQRIFTYCMTLNTSVFMIPDLFDISIKNATLQDFDDMPVFRIGKLRLSWEQKAAKRLFDIVFSLAAIVLSSPLMLLVALVVKCTSPGPVLYKQDRITENNRIFKVLKFRTMHDGAEGETGPVLAFKDDPRVTRVGFFLRRSRLDEFPQFFNVLAGDMSVVGPRPERPFFIEQFKKDLPDYDYRATVKTGITGYAQVRGKYSTSFEDKLRYDLVYIKNWSLWLDVTLCFQTLKVFFMKEASEGINENNV